MIITYMYIYVRIYVYSKSQIFSDFIQSIEL